MKISTLPPPLLLLLSLVAQPTPAAADTAYAAYNLLTLQNADEAAVGCRTLLTYRAAADGPPTAEAVHRTMMCISFFDGYSLACKRPITRADAVKNFVAYLDQNPAAKAEPAPTVIRRAVPCA